MCCQEGLSAFKRQYEKFQISNMLLPAVVFRVFGHYSLLTTYSHSKLNVREELLAKQIQFLDISQLSFIWDGYFEPLPIQELLPGCDFLVVSFQSLIQTSEINDLLKRRDFSIFHIVLEVTVHGQVDTFSGSNGCVMDREHIAPKVLTS